MLQLPEWYAAALSRTAGVNLASPKALREIAPVVKYLSARFMRQEDAIPENYFSDAQIRRAYLTYFFTTNVLKITKPLDELSLSGFFDGRTALRALDIGSGVGTAVAGLWMWLAGRHPAMQLDVTATDASQQACREAEQAISIFREYLQSPILKFRSVVVPIEKLGGEISGKYDVLIAQNVLVESPRFTEIIVFAQNVLAENGAIILIEPASRFGSRNLLTFRDALTAAGYTIYAPCVRQGDCPALEKKTDWCHAVSRWTRPPFIRIIDEETGTLRLSLKYSYVVAMKEKRNIGQLLQGETGEDSTLYRVVSERMDEKGRKKFFGCGTNGRLLFEKQKRDTTPEIKDFDSAERYDLVRISGTGSKGAMQRIRKDGAAKVVRKWE